MGHPPQPQDPADPPPPRGKVGIVLLIILGLPLLLLGGCAAILVSLHEAKGQAIVRAGGTITLRGADPALRVAVTLTQVFSPATPARDPLRPKAGNRIVAIHLTLSNEGQAVYRDAPSTGAWLIDGMGQRYRSSALEVREGPSFGRTATLVSGDTRHGVIVFELPEAAKPVRFRFALSNGLSGQKAEWALR